MASEAISETPDESFNVANSVTLFTGQSTTINNLWAVFVAATFSAAGFGISIQLNVWERLGVTIGYLAFAAGHASLLHIAITLQNTLASELGAAISLTAGKFHRSLRTLITYRSRMFVSFAAHAIIDLCVIVIIWVRWPVTCSAN